VKPPCRIHRQLEVLGRGLLLAVALLFVVPASEVGAGMHRYRDDSGRVHIVDSIEKVPEQYRDQVKTTETSPASPRRSQPRVEIFITSWCGYCQKLEKFLKSKRIRYSRYDIEKSSSARQRYQKLGGTGVPVVKIGSKVIRGYNTDAILKQLGRRK
jgi:glutaredoxin